MNSPSSRFAGISRHVPAPNRQAGVNLWGRKISLPALALMGGGCAVVLALSGLLISSFVGRDPVQTASIAASATPADAAHADSGDRPQPTDASDQIQTAAAAESATSKQARQPVATPPVNTVPVADTSHWSTQPQQGFVARADGQDTGPAANEPDAAADTVGKTPDPTASVSAAPDGLRGTLDVQVAETEAEIAKLEAATGMVDETVAKDAASTSTPAATPPAPGPLPKLETAQATKFVNLRAEPAGEAKVIVVIPENAAIEAETDCGWCTVVYKGQRGYIYKSFINRGTAEKEATNGVGLY